MRTVLHGAFLLAMAAVPAAHAGETVLRDLGNTKIIRSNEAPHNILGEACLACHPKETFDFWLLIYKGKPPTLAIDPGQGKREPQAAGPAATAPAKGNRYNAHDALQCGICHLENPTAANPRFIVDVAELCRLCHPGTEMHRLPAGDNLARVKRAIRDKTLPGREGEPLCTTCHRIHESTFSMRQAYAQVLWEGKIPNPHGSRLLCFACHPGRIREGEEVRLAAGRDNIRLCNECHEKPGVKKTPHVVNVPSSEGTWRMDYLGYPLSQGKLICSTCHDEVSHGKPDPANPKFLRGGPYAGEDQFCFRCHLEDKEAYNNPHRQVDAFGRIRQDSCRFCHRKDPDPSRKTAANLEMVGEDSAICPNCHQIRPHPERDHYVPLLGEKLRRKEDYEARHQVKMPLTASGKVSCSTCHNPHGKGVLKNESGVGAGSKWRVPDFREVCAPCHGRY
jgi:hypothetical protein